jgi:hypothetical protein
MPRSVIYDGKLCYFLLVVLRGNYKTKDLWYFYYSVLSNYICLSSSALLYSALSSSFGWADVMEILV